MRKSPAAVPYLERVGDRKGGSKVIEILNKYTSAVIYTSATADTIAAAVVEAAVNGADLARANLARADLTGAKTEGAVIPAWSLTIVGSRHVITAFADRVLIGCHSRDIDSWLKIYTEVGKREKYDDAAIEEYGGHLRRIKAVMAVMEQERERMA